MCFPATLPLSEETNRLFEFLIILYKLTYTVFCSTNVPHIGHLNTLRRGVCLSFFLTELQYQPHVLEEFLPLSRDQL